jgi:hypothetical protein
MEGLICLPEDVVLDIMTGWLGLPDVARLDSAVCCGFRGWLIRLLSIPVYDTIQFVQDFSPRSADWFTNWLYSRTVKVTSIYVSRAFVGQNKRRDSYLKICGKYVTNVSIGTRGHPMWLPLSSLSKFCPNIASIGGRNFFTHEGFQKITETWPALRSLELENSCHSDLMFLAERCRQLQSFAISFRLSEEFKRTFVQALPPTMEVLNLGEYACIIRPGQNPPTWYQLLPQLDFPHLRAFNRDEMSRFTECELLTGAQRCPLRTLHIAPGERVRDSTLHALQAHCSHVQEIIIGPAHGITEEGVARLFQGCARTLRKVNYKGLVRVPAVLTALGMHCLLLEELVVHAERFCHRGQTRSLPGLKSVAQGCTRLSSLTAIDCIMTDEDMSALAEGCPELRVFSLQGEEAQRRLSDRAMQAIGCKNLWSLKLIGNVQVTDAGLNAAVSCRYLRSFKLEGISCNDAPLFAMAAHCCDLRVVHLLRAQYGSHSKGVPTVTGAGVTAVVTRFKKLRELYVDSAFITAAIVPVIAEHCKLLRELCLSVRMGNLEETAAKALFDEYVQVRFTLPPYHRTHE